jgi:hypothetical protein
VNRRAYLVPTASDHLFFFSDKELFACETAQNDFFKIVYTVGGDKERERARELMKRVAQIFLHFRD